jgi:hypothetical protein
MSIIPEKNDVDISKLFTWGKEVAIKDDDGNELFKCYIRMIGDADLNRSRVYALRRSAEFRKKLHDADSDERVGFIVEPEMVSKEKLVQATLIILLKDVAQKVQKDVNIPFPKELTSDATQEEEEKYQAEVDAYPEKVRQEITARIEKEAKKEEARLNTFSKKELYDSYVDYVINELCEREMFDQFKLSCLLYGCFRDPEYKTRLFKTIEEITALPSTVKNQLLDEYSSLEMSTDFLKQ